MAEQTQVTLSHEERTRDMIVRIMAIVTEHLPELSGTSKVERRRLANAASVPDEFLEEIAVSVDNSPEMGTVHELTSDEARDLIVFSRVSRDRGHTFVLLRTKLSSGPQLRASSKIEGMTPMGTHAGEACDLLHFAYDFRFRL